VIRITCSFPELPHLFTEEFAHVRVPCLADVSFDIPRENRVNDEHDSSFAAHAARLLDRTVMGVALRRSEMTSSTDARRVFSFAAISHSQFDSLTLICFMCLLMSLLT
jgi:hypothetical protein